MKISKFICTDGKEYTNLPAAKKHQLRVLAFENFLDTLQAKTKIPREQAEKMLEFLETQGLLRVEKLQGIYSLETSVPVHKFLMKVKD